MASPRRLLLFLFILLSSSVVAQQAVIKGKLRDNEGGPLPGAAIVVLGKTISTATDNNGNFSLSVPSGELLQLVFSFTGMKNDTVTVRLEPNEVKDISKSLHLTSIQIKDVNIQGESIKKGNTTTIDPVHVKNIPTINQSVEDVVKTQAGVSSNNELSSTYSVRGGSYDENLIYINDFEVYRPQLVRSGQQEGLSVINPDMVENIKFSSGGFDAIYGDKLSSVLDIQYRRPKKFAGSISASLLGANLELENRSKNTKWYYMAGLRQKSNQYILNTFETKGEYKPSFTDVQVLTGYEFTKKFTLEFFGNYARNKYALVPQTRETNFGTINDAKRFTVYFDGQEVDKFQTFTGAMSAIYQPKETVKLKLIGTAFNTHEEESFDILGQYFLDQLETDLGKDDFGTVAYNLGVGSFLNHGRNRLDGTVIALEHKGEIIDTSHNMVWQWGAKVQHEDFADKLHEWNYIDSAGYSIPSPRDSFNAVITLNDVAIAKNSLVTNRISAYIQNNWELGDSAKFIITTGVRVNYSDINQELLISPRASVSYSPKHLKRLKLRASAGYYYQPAFYHEVRNFDGVMYPETKAQKSIHLVLGGDLTFLALGQEFKLTSEVYYKSLENLIPYVVDNIRLRYLPEYTSKGYSRGVDLRLYGEFVSGTESWMSLSVMQTEEDIKNDFYYRFFNADGEEIIPGFTFDQRHADSIKVEPGYLPRPADQRVTFGLYFQDFLPKFPTYKMQLSLIFGTPLPFGPPGKDRYKDVLRSPSYIRGDIGFSKQIIGEEVKKKPKGKFLNSFSSMWVGLEVFNLLQVSNVASYTWITDISTARKYAVPNYLTGRQINLRISAQF